MRGTGLGYAYSEIIKQGKRPSTPCGMECARLEYSAIEFYEKSGAKVLRDWYVVQMDEVGINNFIENKLKNKLQLHLKAGI
jgi:hypothetical protein